MPNEKLTTITRSREDEASADNVVVFSPQQDGPISHGGIMASEMDREELRLVGQRVKRKMDMRLLGMAWVMLILNYLDRCTIAAARLSGLEESLNMNSTQYGIAIGILYVGYILMQVPSNMVLTKLRPSLYLPSCMVVWGITSACTSLIQEAWSLYLIRFLLGFVEAPFTVGALLLISSWYTRSELGVRSAVLLSAPLLGSAVSGLVSAGVTVRLEGAAGLEAWRWMFVIGGAATIVVACAAFFCLPDFPSNTRWLSAQERAVAEWRLVLDVGLVDEDVTNCKSGFNMARKDWRVYVFAAMYLLLSMASSVHNFFPSIVQTLGFSRLDTLLLTVPPYLLAILVAIVNNWSADRTENSSFHIVWPLVVGIVGFCTCAATLNTWARYFAMILMIAGGHGANAVVLSWAQKTMIRPQAKRACVLAFVNATGTLAQILTSFMYPNQSAPRYFLAMTVNAASSGGAIVLALIMRVILQYANKKLAGCRVSAAVVTGEGQAAPGCFSDQERQVARRPFRYAT